MKSCCINPCTRPLNQKGEEPDKIMSKDEKSLTALKDVLSSLFSSGELPFNPEDAKIWKIWEEVVGVGISKHARPSWIKDGILRVNVSDPIWCQELQYSENEIRQRLNRQLGRNAVVSIEFRLGLRYGATD